MSALRNLNISKNINKKILLRKHRSTTEKIHAPYRGVSSREDVANVFAGMTHDLVYIQRKLGEKEGVDGLKQFDKDNLSLLLQGEGKKATTSLETAGTYTNIIDLPNASQKVSDSVWTLVGPVVKSTVGKNIQLVANGTSNNCYVKQSVPVRAGDIVYLRLKVKKVKGRVDDCSISFANSKGVLLSRKTISFEDTNFIYVDHKVYCEQNENIEVRIYVYDTPQVLEATTIEIENVKLSKLQETSFSMPGLRKGLLRKINESKETLRFLSDHMKGGK